MTSWTPSDWLLLLNGIDTAGTVIVTLALLWLRSQFPTKAQHEALEDRVQGHSERLHRGDGRMDLIEHQLRAVPSGEQMTKLVLGIERLSGDMRALSVKIEGMDALHKTLERQVGVMDEWMRSGDRR